MPRKFKWQSIIESNDLDNEIIKIVTTMRATKFVDDVIRNNVKLFEARNVPSEKIEEYCRTDRAMLEKSEIQRLMKFVRREMLSNRAQILEEYNQIVAERQARFESGKSETISNVSGIGKSHRMPPSIHRVCEYHGISISEFYEQPPQVREKMLKEAS